MSVTGSFTIPLDLAAPPERVWSLFAELPLVGEILRWVALAAAR